MRKTILLATLSTLAAADLPEQKKFYRDDPLWTMPRPAAVVTATKRSLNEYYDFLENTLFPTGERPRNRREYLPSRAINTVDEVPDSGWYTNRHARHRMSIAQLQSGPGISNPPAPGIWTVIAAKNEGVTPGFRIRDAVGRTYFVKFDPVSNPEMASAADVITSKFFYALGYNVPENYIVHFDRSRITVGEGALMKDGTGRRRPITGRDIDQMLAKVPRSPDGSYRALASRAVPGKPMGPFRYDGTRNDDPNDLIPHEHRRDLRALRTLCAWLGHDDSKALNTLDVLVQEGGIPFIRHYLIDFGASLGSASLMANSPRDGNVYLFDWKSSAAQLFTVGLYTPKWQRAKYPKLPAAGRFEYEVFDPERWVGDYPSAAFRNENSADRLWAARKIAAFTEEEIRAVVATGQYSDPAAAEWVARCLIERRKKILGAFHTGMAALDGFAIRENRLVFQPDSTSDLRIQWSVFDNDTGYRRTLPGERTLEVPQVADAEYIVAELAGNAAPGILVYIKCGSDPKVVGVERQF